MLGGILPGVSEQNVELVRRQIGDVDLAQALRDNDAWASRLADIESFFKDDFEFVVAVPGEPVTGRGFESSAACFWTGSNPGRPISRTSSRSSISEIALSY